MVWQRDDVMWNFGQLTGASAQQIESVVKEHTYVLYQGHLLLIPSKSNTPSLGTANLMIYLPFR